MNVEEFREIVWEYYRSRGRELPWRRPAADGSFDAYKILVSELMLQQTQVSRVIPKYREFLEKFPSLQSLAEAPLADVLKVWNGLGYNRRAKYLHGTAQTLVHRVGPWTPEMLENCKGIGANTAAAVCVYAYNEPLVFIETNIRTVFIHHFFKDKDDIHDKEILPLVEQTLDREHPREWYWALMDYGVFLKATVGNASRASRHYAKQSTFKGSRRQLRGLVLRVLGEQTRSASDLIELLGDERSQGVLAELEREGLVSRQNDIFRLG